MNMKPVRLSAMKKCKHGLIGWCADCKAEENPNYKLIRGLYTLLPHGQGRFYEESDPSFTPAIDQYDFGPRQDLTFSAHMTEGDFRPFMLDIDAPTETRTVFVKSFSIGHIQQLAVQDEIPIAMFNPMIHGGLHSMQLSVAALATIIHLQLRNKGSETIRLRASLRGILRK